MGEPTMSGIHAKIFSGTDGIRIRDLNSLNGTQVNGSRIVESLLRNGDQIKHRPGGDPGRRLTELGLPPTTRPRRSPWRLGERLPERPDPQDSHLDELRQDRDPQLEEDHYILLLQQPLRGAASRPPIP